jgi:hypothetical protein
MTEPSSATRERYPQENAVKKSNAQLGFFVTAANRPGICLSRQQRLTATFRRFDGRILHVCKMTAAEPVLRKIASALRIDAAPEGVRKLLV